MLQVLALVLVGLGLRHARTSSASRAVRSEACVRTGLAKTAWDMPTLRTECFKPQHALGTSHAEYAHNPKARL